jgi:hypothetical protein
LWRAFATRTDGFFLTGGAALVCYLGHRETEDLDFASLDRALAVGAAQLEVAAATIGAGVVEERLESAAGPEKGRRRFRVRRGDEQTKVDLIRPDRPGYLRPDILDGCAIDRKEQLFVNKLAALASRSEPRDLVDLRALEADGQTLEGAAERVRERLGFSAAALANSLRGWHIPADAALPESVTVAELEAYRRDLIARLARLAFPR